MIDPTHRTSNSPPTQVFVLIPSHNRRDILCATLDKVRSQLPSKVARLIVVDAGSTDGTRIAAQTCCPTAEIVAGSADMWWTATVNHGMRYIAQSARADDRIILMNDDVDLHPQALIQLLDASAREPLAIIGAVNIINPPGQVQRVYFSGGRYNFRSGRHKVNIQEGSTWNEPTSRFLDTDFLYGRLLVFPWLLFQNGCRFDEESFPQYIADEEFTYNAKQLGYKVLVDSRSIVYVNEATTTNFSLNFKKSGVQGIGASLTAFNSPYNFKQYLIFAKRYAKWPLLYVFFRYALIVLGENIRK